MLKFSQWIKLNEVKLTKKSGENISNARSSEPHEEIHVLTPTEMQQPRNTTTKLKTASEHKKPIYKTTLKKLRESLQDYFDQVVPMKPPKRQNHTTSI